MQSPKHIYRVVAFLPRSYKQVHQHLIEAPCELAAVMQARARYGRSSGSFTDDFVWRAHRVEDPLTPAADVPT